MNGSPPLDLVEPKNEGDNQVYRYRLKYQRASLFVRGTFNKENKITKFAIFGGRAAVSDWAGALH